MRGKISLKSGKKQMLKAKIERSQGALLERTPTGIDPALARPRAATRASGLLPSRAGPGTPPIAEDQDDGRSGRRWSAPRFNLAEKVRELLTIAKEQGHLTR